MSWEGMFDDLEGQWEAAERRDRDLEVADRTRRERSQIELVTRLVAHCGQSLDARLCSGTIVRGRLTDVGDGWLAIEGVGTTSLIPLTAVVSLDALTRKVDAAASARRFGFGYAVRRLSRDRAQVVLEDCTGGLATGTIDVVGADHLDLALHPSDEPRRDGNVRAHRVVPFAVVARVSSQPQ